MDVQTKVLEGIKLEPHETHQLFVEIERKLKVSTHDLMQHQRDKNGLNSYEILAAKVHDSGDSKKTILDLGCGRGEILNYLEASRIERYVGVDLSSVSIQNADRSARPFEVEYINSDAANLNLPANSFQLIISHMFLHMCTDLIEVLKTAQSVLDDGGQFISIVRKYGDSNDMLDRIRPILNAFMKEHYPNFTPPSTNPLITQADAFSKTIKSVGFDSVTTEDFYLFQNGPKELMVDFLMSLYPACLVPPEKANILVDRLNKELSQMEREEMALPMRMLTLA